MDYLPLFLDVKNKPCLVVGGGRVASRKLSLLIRAQARITVVAPDITPEIRDQVDEDRVIWLQKKITPEDLKDFQLVLVATDDRDVNSEIATYCKERNILVNTADDVQNCNFILPSMIDRSPVQIAVSTGGASPVLARMLRAKLENCIPAAYGQLAKLIESYRLRVKEKFSTTDQKRKFWEENPAGPPLPSLCFPGNSVGRKNCCRIQLNIPVKRICRKGRYTSSVQDPGTLTC